MVTTRRSGGHGGKLMLLLAIIAFIVFWPYVKAAFQPTSGPAELNRDDSTAIVRLGDGKVLTDAGYAIIRRDGSTTLWEKQYCTNPDDVAACSKETRRQFRVKFWRDWQGNMSRVEITDVWLLGDPVSNDPNAIRPLRASCVRVYGATATDLLTKPLPQVTYCK